LALGKCDEGICGFRAGEKHWRRLDGEGVEELKTRVAADVEGHSPVALVAAVYADEVAA
jgi:hypothetical protein